MATERRIPGKQASVALSQRANPKTRFCNSVEKWGVGGASLSYTCEKYVGTGWDGWTKARFMRYRWPNLACSVPTLVGPIRVYTSSHMSDPVRCSELIETLKQAQELYSNDLAGARTITCSGKRVTIVFERDATHVYSVSWNGVDVLGVDERAERLIPIGRGKTRIEVRRFNLERACLMSYILPAISNFTVSVPESGGHAGHQKRVLYGPSLPHSNDHMRVVLRNGPGDALTCVSAYPVSREEWLKACKLKRAKFPP